MLPMYSMFPLKIASVTVSPARAVLLRVILAAVAAVPESERFNMNSNETYVADEIK